MKIGILTYQNTRNCGAMLQVYALQTLLDELHMPNEIINYHCKKIDDTYKIKSILEMRNVKSLIKWILTIRSNVRAQKKFDLFAKGNLKLSDSYNLENVSRANEYFDIFLTGSDQVWNFKLNGGDMTYLLNFVEYGKKKISYAASAGGGTINTIPEEIVRNELCSFDAISVREKDLSLYIRDILGKKIDVVLDPTFLIKKEQYMFNGEVSIPYDKYIFIYTVAPAPNIDVAVKRILQTRKYKVIWGHMSCAMKKGVINKTDLSPIELVEYIKHAEYVLTSSFHGMALSIIMEKQFFFDLDINKENNNARINNLAEMLGLQNRRLVGDTTSGDVQMIDYVNVNKVLDRERNKSIRFLYDAIIE